MNEKDQPIGYWTGAAEREVIRFIRGELVKLGLTQPQYWLLRNLSPHDISPDGQGLTIAELTEKMSDYLPASDDLAAESAGLVAQGLLRRDGADRLWITDAGEAAHKRVKEHAPAIRERIHEGIDDADYVTTVRVLQRMIRNVAPAPSPS